MIGEVRLWGGLLVTALITLVGCTATRGVRVGEAMPPFSVEGWDGGTISMASLVGRPACIDLWASWCPACTPALPALDAIARRHPGVTMVAVNIDASRADAERSLAARLPDRRLTLGRDPDARAFGRLGANTVPTLFVVDRSGVVRLVEHGYRLEQLGEVERLLDELSAGTPAR